RNDRQGSRAPSNSWRVKMINARFASLARNTIARDTGVRDTGVRDTTVGNTVAHENRLMLRHRRWPHVASAIVTGALLVVFFSFFVVTSASAQVTPKKKKPAPE